MPQKLRRATLHSVARVGPRSLAPSDAGVDGARERDEARVGCQVVEQHGAAGAVGERYLPVRILSVGAGLVLRTSLAHGIHEGPSDELRRRRRDEGVQRRDDLLLGRRVTQETTLAEECEHGGALGIRFNLGFNIFGWQALFFSGLYFGFRMVERPVDLDFLRQDQYRAAFLITLAIVAGLAIFDRIVGGEVFGDAYSTALMAHTDRGLLAWIYPFAFLLDLFAVVWLLRVGATDKAGWIRGLSRLVAWVFTARPLVFLGQHSLHVFSFHILVFYALAQFAPGLGLGEFGASLLLIASVASLWLAAWGHAWLQARDAARADDAASAAVRR